MKLSTTLFATMIACSLAHAQDAAPVAHQPSVFGLVTYSADGREIPVPPGVRLTFRGLGGKDTYNVETQRPVDRLGRDRDEDIAKRPVNYWLRGVPGGRYKVMIRGEGFLPYNDPKTHVLPSSGKLRIDFAGLRRKVPQAGQAATVGGGADTEQAAAPAGGSTGNDNLGGSYAAEFKGWGTTIFKSSYAKGETFVVTFKFKNAGTQPWQIQTTPMEGFVYAKQIGSPNLVCSGWVVDHQTVLPGETGRWTVHVRCPTQGGGFNLQFRLHRGLGNNGAINEPTPSVRINVQ